MVVYIRQGTSSRLTIWLGEFSYRCPTSRWAKIQQCTRSTARNWKRYKLVTFPAIVIEPRHTCRLYGTFSRQHPRTRSTCARRKAKTQIAAFAIDMGQFTLACYPLQKGKTKAQKPYGRKGLHIARRRSCDIFPTKGMRSNLFAAPKYHGMLPCYLSVWRTKRSREWKQYQRT